MIERTGGTGLVRLLARAAIAALVLMSLNSPSDAQNSGWWYCSDTHQFYPYTQQCSHWRHVRPYHAVPLQQQQPRNIVPQPQEQQDNAQPVSPPAQAPEQEQADGGAQGNTQPALRSVQDQPGSAATDQRRAQTSPRTAVRHETTLRTSANPVSEKDSTNVVLFLLVVAALVLLVIKSPALYRAYRKKVLTEKIMGAVRATVGQHERTLVRKRRQTLHDDDYGIPITGPWDKEKSNFVERVLEPAIRQIGPKAHALYQVIQPAILREIENLTKQAAAAATQAFAVRPNPTGTEYEQDCAALLKQVGWNAHITKASGDQGVDVIAEKGGKRLVVQCKYYSQPVGNKAVQEVFTARQHEQADWAVVVSNASYTASAKQLAATTGVFLLHHSELERVNEILSARPEPLQGPTDNDGSAWAVPGNLPTAQQAP